MMNRGMESMIEEPIRNHEIHSDLWHACVGETIQIPNINTDVVYFPQGHAEQAIGNVDFGNTRFPPFFPCRLSSVSYMSERETDEVFVKYRLDPPRNNEFNLDDDDDGHNEIRSREIPEFFAKTLTQSDANNGGGFSVPRFCAEKIFPRLDFSVKPPVQTILVKDVHGEIWKFRHIFRGSPRRHLLTTGWSNFVNQKKLVAGDSIIFTRDVNGDLCVAIRRARKGIGCGIDYSSGWNSTNSGSPILRYSDFMREGDKSRLVRRNPNGRVRVESVIEATMLAASGKPFEVLYYPCAGTPEFVVKASVVRSAMQARWYSPMRFKVPLETEDASRLSWFVGTISSIQLADPTRWPGSPWRLLQVTWDEPELLQHLKTINPWLIEVLANMPAIDVSPFSPPRKKPRFSLPSETTIHDHFPLPSFSTNFFDSTNPLHSITANSIPAGIQGARHTQFGLSSFNHQISRPHLGQFPAGLKNLGGTPPLPAIRSEDISRGTKSPENISHWLTMGSHIQSSKESQKTKPDQLLLFGKLILLNEPISNSSSGDTANASDANLEKTSNLSDGSGLSSQQIGSREISSDGGSSSYNNQDKTGISLEIENVGRTH